MSRLKAGVLDEQAIWHSARNDGWSIKDDAANYFDAWRPTRTLSWTPLIKILTIAGLFATFLATEGLTTAVLISSIKDLVTLFPDDTEPKIDDETRNLSELNQLWDTLNKSFNEPSDYYSLYNKIVQGHDKVRENMEILSNWDTGSRDDSGHFFLPRARKLDDAVDGGTYEKPLCIDLGELVGIYEIYIPAIVSDLATVASNIQLAQKSGAWDMLSRDPTGTYKAVVKAWLAAANNLLNLIVDMPTSATEVLDAGPSGAGVKQLIIKYVSEHQECETDYANEFSSMG